MKSVFIIAIVAVAMIGVMVPNGFSAYEPCKDPSMSNHPACSKKKSNDIDVSNYCEVGESRNDCRYLPLQKLAGKDLSHANLRYADLSNANLLGADLRYANLFGADLSNANFAAANLFGADLREANISGVDFSATNISHTKFSDEHDPIAESKQKEKERKYAAEVKREAEAKKEAERKEYAAAKAAAERKVVEILAPYHAAVDAAAKAKTAVDNAAAKIASLDEKLGKSNTRDEANSAAEIRKEARDEYESAVDAAAKAVEEEKVAEDRAIRACLELELSIRLNHNCMQSNKEITSNEDLLLYKWQSQTFEKSNSDKSIKDSDEKWERSSSAEKDIDRIFDNPDLPKPGFSDELKDHISTLPTEKEIFDNRMLAEATTPKEKPWWCFWC